MVNGLTIILSFSASNFPSIKEKIGDVYVVTSHHNPAKRDVSSARFRFQSGMLRECIGFWDENCINDSGTGDGDIFDDGNNPGKRLAPLLHSQALLRSNPVNNYFNKNNDQRLLYLAYLSPLFKANPVPKVCPNPFDANCINNAKSKQGSNPNIVGDPWKLLVPAVKPFPFPQSIPTDCVNVMDENCSNDSGNGDGDVFDPGNSPGKRSIPIDSLRQNNVFLDKFTKRRCLNTFDEQCANDRVLGSGSDGYFNSNKSPGKRGVPQLQVF